MMTWQYSVYLLPLQWRHNGRDGVSNHQPHHCLLSYLFRRRSKKTSKLRVMAFLREIHQWPVNSPHKGPVTRKKFPFDDVIIHMTTVVLNLHIVVLEEIHLRCSMFYLLQGFLILSNTFRERAIKCKCATPSMFPPLDIVHENWIEHIALEPLQLIVLAAFGAVD